MKLVRIEHISCFEYDGYTYLVADDDITQKKLEADIKKAMAAYREATDIAKPFNGRTWDSWQKQRPLSSYADSTTVKEVLEIQKKHKEEFEAWDKARRTATRPFGSYMVDLGYREFWDYEPEITAEADWGHEHVNGTILNEGITVIPDLPGSLQMETITEEGKTKRVAKVTER